MGPSSILGSSAQSSTTGKRSPCTSGCEKQQKLWLSETWGCRNRRHSSWKACTWTYSVMNSLALSSNARAAAQRVPETYEEELSCQASDRGLEGWLSPRLNYPLFLSWAATISESPATWLIQVAPRGWFPETPPHFHLVGPPKLPPVIYSIQIACLGLCCQLS